MSEQNEGWWKPVISRKVHYFRKQRSLCGRYGCVGVERLLPDDGRDLVEGCTPCTRKLREKSA